MGNIIIQCPNCHESGFIDDKFVGRTIKCNKCNSMFEVTADLKPSIQMPEVSAETMETTEPLEATEKSYCIKCGTRLTLEAVFCSKCGVKVASTDSDHVEVIQTGQKSNELNDQSIMTRNLGCLPFIGLFMLVGGIAAVIYFAAFFDTSISVPTTEIFGQTIGGGRVNNIGLMNDRSNGIMIGIGATIFGLILSIVTMSKSKN
jgi:hypothetical protein